MRSPLFRPSRLRRMVKEAFDNLPSGICFFDGNGVVTLCNRQMHRLIFTLTGRDLQSLYELRELTAGASQPFLLPDGTAWQFSEAEVVTDDGTPYTQAVASDVTLLCKTRRELEANNRELAELGRRLRRLSESVAAVTREEEILTMKMRVHDDIGRSVIATRRLLQQGRPTEELDLSAWKDAIALLRCDSESPGDGDALAQLQEAAAGIGVRIRLDGALPDNAASAYLLIAAMRECASNAVRHAGGTELYVQLFHGRRFAVARIRNNGRVPGRPIVEGGGLSSLRSRVEKAGGILRIRTEPGFELTVSVPITEEELP